MITILDGGMGAELIRRGSASRDELWSAQALLDAPNDVIPTHLDFIQAGARIITTNSYSCVPSYLGKAGLAGEYQRLAALAGKLARDAVSQTAFPVLVAGSLPPLQESYRADLVPENNEARGIYGNIADALEPYIDLFICETMSSSRETRNAAIEAKKAAQSRELPVYVSWTLDEKPGLGLRSGESIKEAFVAINDLKVDGYLCNCSSPEAIEAGVEQLSLLTTKPIGGYPNRFVGVPDGWTLDNGKDVGRREDLDPIVFAQIARRCIEKGATIFGGCCGVGPEHIAAISNELNTPP